jgi:hypothetical protein
MNELDNRTKGKDLPVNINPFSGMRNDISS